MDPDAVWKLLGERLRDLKRNLDDTEAREKAAACLMILYRWLRMGGFLPGIKDT